MKHKAYVSVVASEPYSAIAAICTKCFNRSLNYGLSTNVYFKLILVTDYSSSNCGRCNPPCWQPSSMWLPSPDKCIRRKIRTIKALFRRNKTDIYVIGTWCWGHHWGYHGNLHGYCIHTRNPLVQKEPCQVAKTFWQTNWV